MTLFRALAAPQRLTFTRIGILFSLLTGIAACETSPPVQEMSDARQAIAVAREAGAESHASVELGQALELLEMAEQELSAEDYARARRNALLAKTKALEARKLSEADKQ